MDIYALILLSMFVFTGVLCYGIYLIMKDIDDLERVIKTNMRRVIYDRDASDLPSGHISPGLKESEDEKVRKALIEYFNEQCDMSDWNGVYGYQVVAWLEKQGKKGGEK